MDPDILRDGAADVVSRGNGRLASGGFVMRIWGLCLLIAAVGCGGGELVPPDEGQVASHSAGAVRRSDDVRITFREEVAPDIGVAARGISLSPKVPGEVRWTSGDTLVFTPEAPMQVGTYTVRVDPDVAEGATVDPFSFRLQVMPTDGELVLDRLEPTEGGTMALSGTVRLSDPLDCDGLLDGLSVQVDGRSHGDWEAVCEGRSDALGFHVTGVPRGEEAGEVQVRFSHRELADPLQGRRVVPDASDFSVTSVLATLDGEGCAVLEFSDLMQPGQDPDGRVMFGDRSAQSLVIEGHRVTACHPDWHGSGTLEVTGLRNVSGGMMPEAFSEELQFEVPLPRVAFVGTGQILPGTAAPSVPVRVSALDGFTAKVYRISRRNLPQFFQDNGFDGEENLRKVARPIHTQHVELPPELRGRTGTVALDLSALTEAQGQGMYRVELTFDIHDAAVTCDTEAFQEALTATVPSDDPLWEPSFWDGAGGFEWEERDNPCHPTFYNPHAWWSRERTDARNLMVSDLGLVVKKGAGDVHVVVTGLDDAAPRAGASVEVLGYTHEVLAEGTTDARGMVRLPVSEGSPWLVRATDGGSHMVLRLPEGGSLSTSHFDVAGAVPQDGLKGFLYGERGVWRPGDTLHLTLALQGAGQSVPEDHPVVFRLFDPQGAVVERALVTDGVGGFHAFAPTTSPSAPTGTWRVEARVGQAAFSRSLRIDAVRPNRLKIELAGGEDLEDVGRAPSLEVPLFARWLHGGTAGDLQASVARTLIPRTVSFDAWSEFSFQGLADAELVEEEEIWSGTLDAGGHATVQAAWDAPDAGDFTAMLTTRVHEPGGLFSEQRQSVPLWSHDTYIGIRPPAGDAARGMLLTDQTHQVDLVAVDAEGELVGDRTVDVRLYEIDWRWWWEAGSEDLGDYADSTNHEPLRQEKVELKGGKGHFDFQIDFPEWGRYLITVDDGERVSMKTLYVDWPGWAGRSAEDNPGGASLLTLVASQPDAQVGDEVTVEFPAGPGTRALVSIENGHDVLDMRWITTDDDRGRVTVPITGEMAPGIYVHVTSLQAFDRANDAPIRTYGILPLEVSDPATRLEPRVEGPPEIKPGTTATFQVSEAQGRPMTYTLAVVDEGLLGLTNFQTPNPWNAFYQRDALGVRTWDPFSSVVGGMSGMWDTTLAIGGGAAEEALGDVSAQRFPPVVEVFGPFALEGGGVASHDVDLGSYLGEVRVMVVGGNGKAFGATDLSVPVRSPLMALASLPRALRAGETLQVPVSLFAPIDPVDAVVDVTVEGPLALDGPARQTVRVDGEGMIDFSLRTTADVGPATVTVTARGAGETSVVQARVQVDHPVGELVESSGQTVPEGGIWTVAMSPDLRVDTRRTQLELSAVPPMDLARHAEQLLRYPHGCTEQIISATMPQIALASLLELDDRQASKLRRHVAEARDRLYQRQTTDGGFAYWPGRPSDAYATTYAGHFLSLAQRAGFHVDPDRLERWKDRETEAAAAHRSTEDANAQAYRLYALALARAPMMSAMNRLADRPLGDRARWLLAAAYGVVGEKDRGLALVADAGIPDGTGHTGNFWRDPAVDRSDALEALVWLGEIERAQEVAESISEELVGGQLHTYGIGRSLAAMSRLAAEADTTVKAKVMVDGDDRGVSLQGLALLDLGEAEEVRVQAQGGRLYARAVQTGLGEALEVAALDQGLTVQRQVLGEGGATIDPFGLVQGQTLALRVAVSNQTARPVDDLAIRLPLPSGFELADDGTVPSRFRADMRDDEVLLYGDIRPGETLTFDVGVVASFQGDFHLPPAEAESMYDGAIRGRSASEAVRILRNAPNN